MRKNAAASPNDALGSKDFVSSLRKGLDVLTCFNREASRLTVSEVAVRTATTPASARRSLRTLHELDYLESDGKRFWVAPKALLVAHSYLASRPTPQLAQPLLDSLAERTRQSASLGKLVGDHAIIIARSTARRSLSTGLGIGSRLPAYCSALGRVLLAGRAPEEARKLVQGMVRKPLTVHTVCKTDEVLAIVARARAEGWASSDEELEIGVRSMAVPVYDRAGKQVAGMSISVRAERMTLVEFKEALLPALLKARDTLAPRLYEPD